MSGKQKRDRKRRQRMKRKSDKRIRSAEAERLVRQLRRCGSLLIHFNARQLSQWIRFCGEFRRHHYSDLHALMDIARDPKTCEFTSSIETRFSGPATQLYHGFAPGSRIPDRVQRWGDHKAQEFIQLCRLSSDSRYVSHLEQFSHEAMDSSWNVFNMTHLQVLMDDALVQDVMLT